MYHQLDICFITYHQMYICKTILEKKINIENENVYVIRYLIDTVVSNRVAGVPIELDYNIYGNNILTTELNLFVSVDEEKKQKIITARGKRIM